MTDFVKASLIRMIRTMAQCALATIGSAVVLNDVNWAVVGSASVLAGILSLLTSIATGLPEVGDFSEVTDDEVISEPVAEYDDAEYDDLYVDDEVEDDELEQEE